VKVYKLNQAATGSSSCSQEMANYKIMHSYSSKLGTNVTDNITIDNHSSIHMS